MVKEGKYGISTLYTCMKMEQTCWNSSKKRGEEIKDNDGGDESS
jgi:hypothetical protein